MNNLTDELQKRKELTSIKNDIDKCIVSVNKAIYRIVSDFDSNNTKLIDDCNNLFRLKSNLISEANDISSNIQAIPKEESIEYLDISLRLYNCLKSAKIKNLHEAAKYSRKQLFKIRMFGKQSFSELNYILEEKGHNVIPW